MRLTIDEKLMKLTGQTVGDLMPSIIKDKSLYLEYKAGLKEVVKKKEGPSSSNRWDLNLPRKSLRQKIYGLDELFIFELE